MGEVFDKGSEEINMTMTMSHQRKEDEALMSEGEGAMTMMQKKLRKGDGCA